MMGMPSSAMPDLHLMRKLSRRHWLALALFSATGAATCGLRWWAASDSSELDDSSVPLADAENVDRLRKLAGRLHPFFSPIPKAEPGDWLETHTELGQTFIQFVRSLPDIRSRRGRKIRIVPLGEFTESQMQLFKVTEEYLNLFFGLEVETLDAISLNQLPDVAQRQRNSGDMQINTSHILQSLLPPLCDNETAVVFGLTNRDLWDGTYSFLYGQGSSAERTCVGSFARFMERAESEHDDALLVRRTIGLATHEIGHVFHIPHCTAFNCRMNGSNHLAESDRRPLEFCPECLPKIWWAFSLDPVARNDSLLAFAQAVGLTKDAALWRQIQTGLNTAAETK